jgi:hypothetical protein
MKAFKGSIDDFLNHCSNLDSDQVELDVENEQVIQEFCKEHNATREEAIEALEAMKSYVVQQTLDKLMNEKLCTPVQMLAISMQPQ